MDRESGLQSLAQSPSWDVVVIGGGATGLGCAVDAAARGYRTALLEQGDFAQATSSRSTKLIHGGLRYLRQGNVGLVREALHERGILLRNAPHLLRTLDVVIPLHLWWERSFYLTGLKLYDRLAGALGLGAARELSAAETAQLVPTILTSGLRGGVLFREAQFDDARLALALAQTCADLGGVPLNYMRVVALLKTRGRTTGVVARDLETGAEYEFGARVVINATGVFSDSIRRLDEPGTAPTLAPSQGAHIVLDRAFLPGPAALMVPRTRDRRVLFAIPWQGRTLIGTTDTAMRAIEAEPRPLNAEIDFLLTLAARHLVRAPKRKDILSCFAGLRPLLSRPGHGRTRSLPRDHAVTVAASGLVTVAGGKWTTYRRMAADTIDIASRTGGLPERPCPTASLPIAELPAAADRTVIHPRLAVRAGDVAQAARHEMARTIADVLARRSPALLTDARAAIESAAAVASLLAAELGRDAQWEMRQVADFTALARRYLPAGA